MENKISLFSPAKINLFLDVVGKREDGYHNLATIFAKLNFGDNITLKTKSAEKTEININITGKNGDKIPSGKDNLIYKACENFLSHFKISAIIDVELEKNIPVGAGLGGGSSNAGGVLKGLAEILKKTSETDFEQIKNIATKLGADVPLFLYKNTFLKGEGIGERLEPIEISDKNNLPYIVLAFPGFGMETKQVFKNLSGICDDNILTNPSNINKIIICLKGDNPLTKWGHLIFNKLEFCAISLNPQIEELKQKFKDLGAEYVLMSGSGSCVYALVSKREKAEEIAKNLTSQLTAENSLIKVTNFL